MSGAASHDVRSGGRHAGADVLEDVLKPEYDGKVAMLDNLNNIQLAASVVTDAKVPTRLTPEQLAKAVDFLIEVKRQTRVIATSYGDMADAMARGEVAITFNGWEVMVNMARKKGKEIAYTYPQEGTFGWCDCYCIVEDAPNNDVGARARQRGHQRAGAGEGRARTSCWVSSTPTLLRRFRPRSRRSTPTTISRASARKSASTRSRRSSPRPILRASTTGRRSISASRTLDGQGGAAGGTVRSMTGARWRSYALVAPSIVFHRSVRRAPGLLLLVSFWQFRSYRLIRDPIFGNYAEVLRDYLPLLLFTL